MPAAAKTDSAITGSGISKKRLRDAATAIATPKMRILNIINEGPSTGDLVGSGDWTTSALSTKNMMGTKSKNNPKIVLMTHHFVKSGYLFFSFVLFVSFVVN